MKTVRYVVIFIIIISFITTELKAEDRPGTKTRPTPNIKVVRASDIPQKEWTMESYRVDTGDVLEMSVWEVEELRRDVVVRPDGKISFPLIGDIQASGKTIEELVKDVTEKLKTYIKNPQVSAIVTSFGGKKVIVLGEISTQGIIRFTEPIRIMEALALAGGYIESSALKTVLVIRGDLENNTEVIVVNVLDLLKGKLSENIYIQKDDIIFVPRTFVGNVAYFIRQISPLLGAAASYYNIKRQYYSIKEKDYRGTTTTATGT
jgi:polysaccharide export outer membrane protein